MDIEDIKDRESLEAWLKTRPREDAVAIAHRAALRVFPLAMSARDQMATGFGDFVYLRILLTNAALSNGRSPEIMNLAVRLNKTNAASLVARGLRSSQVLMAFDAALLSLSLSISANNFAYLGSRAVEVSWSSIASVLDMSLQSHLSRFPPDDMIVPAMSPSEHEVFTDFWEVVRADISIVTATNDALQLPLWPDTPPDWFTQADHETRAIWAENPEHWDFWTRWWDATIAGAPLVWGLQRDIALIPDDVWKQGPSPVAEAIREIEARHALELTANGEALVVNPETGFARLVAETDLPDDIATYARRKMKTALRRFGPELDNQYRPLEPAHARLRETLEDSAALPVELFDACASSSRMVVILVRNDAVPSPETDALISEYLTLIREAAADILAHDIKTQDIITRRNAIQGNNALIENGEAIRFTADQLAKVSEGPLSRLMRRDAEVATDPKADTENRKDSSFRLAGRILRFGTFAVSFVAGTARTITSIKEIGRVGSWIIARPEFQQAWSAILRFLGFA